MKTKILADFQICSSVTLTAFKNLHVRGLTGTPLNCINKHCVKRAVFGVGEIQSTEEALLNYVSQNINFKLSI